MSYALVILCGGNSTRMGSDKALLPFGEFCLIEYIVRKFKPYFGKIYLSVKKKGDYRHLNLPVTEIPDIYPNAGPMSGIFSGLSMMDEEAAFFMSVDTPFLEPETGIALLEAIGDNDICLPGGNTAYLAGLSAAYSKNCITVIGKCLLLRKFTFQTLQDKCRTVFLEESALICRTSTPLETQFFNLDTRPHYYKALKLQSEAKQEPHYTNVPLLPIVAKPGAVITPFLDRLLPLLRRDGLQVLFFSLEDKNLILHDPGFDPQPENLRAALTGYDLILMEYAGTDKLPPETERVEILREGWSMEPMSSPSSLLAILTDYPYKTDFNIPVYDLNRPQEFLTFLRNYSKTH